MSERWPPQDHWAIRTRRRQVLVGAILFAGSVVATVVSWTDRSGGLAGVSAVVSPVAAVLIGGALVATLRRR